MIVCLRTIAVPSDERNRYLDWSNQGRAVRETHGILTELAAGPHTFPTEETQP